MIWGAGSRVPRPFFVRFRQGGFDDFFRSFEVASLEKELFQV
jgi:hypothetical protein